MHLCRPQNINYGRDQNLHTGAGDLNVNNIGRDLVQNCTTTMAFSPYEALRRTVAAAGASHTSEQQYTRGTCLEGTREEALGDIHTWRTSGKPSLPICWLVGKAGVGKSAIAMTVAKACEEDGLVASFFFFRSDPKRNNPSALIPTIALGLMSKFPPLCTFIDERIHWDPTILEANLEDQFRELVLKPSLRMKQSGLEKGKSVQKVPNLVIIDGLDECGDEDAQLRILSVILSSYQQFPSAWSPLRFLICSRPEAWIQEAFDEVDLSRVTQRIALTDTYQTDRDIKRYFEHEFESIRTSPKYSRLRFPSPWPSQRDLRRLVHESSSQFVYAATAVKIVKTPYSNPLDQLRTILEYDPGNPSSKSPFPELDRLYHIILSINPNREKLLLVLAAVLILDIVDLPRPLSSFGNLDGRTSPEFIAILLDLDPGDVHLTLRAMHSVLDIHEDRITVLHTSFRDYLFDRTRSGIFFIDQEAQTHHLVRRWLQALSAERLRQDGFHQLLKHTILHEGWIKVCTRLSQPSRELLMDLQHVELTAVFIRFGFGNWGGVFDGLVSWLQQSNSRDLDLTTMIDRFKNRPKRCHLESSIDLEESEESRAAFEALENDMILGITGYHHSLGARPVRMLWENVERLGSRSSFMITDCRCRSDADFALSSRFHERYEAACLRAVKSLASSFSSIVQSRGRPYWAYRILVNLVNSSLLQHCVFGPELFTQCRILFPDNVEFFSGLLFKHSERERNKLLDWLETFPQHYASEREELKSKVVALFDYMESSAINRDESELGNAVQADFGA
ncbi:hypothetical protein PQX77_011380 [Marasmius sp. AFHP31]|nr:hypothetical protein PQX77_011380 [Marasmius sp. AFHP31]